MRKLNTGDVFAAARLLKVSNLRAELNALVLKISKEEKPDLEKVGIDSILAVVESLSDRGAEREFYALLSGPLEMDPDAVRDMDLDAFECAIRNLIAQNDILRFFRSASGVAGKN